MGAVGKIGGSSEHWNRNYLVCTALYGDVGVSAAETVSHWSSEHPRWRHQTGGLGAALQCHRQVALSRLRSEELPKAHLPGNPATLPCSPEPWKWFGHLL